MRNGSARHKGTDLETSLDAEKAYALANVQNPPRRI
jgi:hypothetical protein